MSLKKDGIIVILSSPSGAGKTTLVKKIAKEKDFKISISHTTRKARTSEVHGKDYFFISESEFKNLIKNNEFLEYAKVFDYYYATPIEPVKNIINDGQDVLFDIDWQGTQQLMNNSNDDLVKVFVLPPSIEELERRLKERKQDNNEIIKKRMSKASDEISHYAEYDYILVNDKFDNTIKNILSILRSERLKNHRQIKTHSVVKKLRNGLWIFFYN